MRAVENGRWVVNAAVSGISAFVDPSGRVVALGGLVRDRYPSAHHPVLRRHARGTSGWGTGSPGSAARLPRSWCRRSRAAGEPRVRNRGRSPATAAHARDPADLRRADDDRVGAGAAAHAPASDVDVLVVDDSSPDGTAELVRDVMSTGAPHPPAWSVPAKSGLASAYLDGFRIGARRGLRPVVEMDSDLSHEPDELPALLAGAAASTDLMIGSRYVPGGSVTNWSRGAGRAVEGRATAYARLMLGLPVHDATSGFRVYRRALLETSCRSPIALRRLRLPDRARDCGPGPLGLRRRRGADHVPRARARPLEDLPPDRRRGAVARHALGTRRRGSLHRPCRRGPIRTVPR